MAAQVYASAVADKESMQAAAAAALDTATIEMESYYLAAFESLDIQPSDLAEIRFVRKIGYSDEEHKAIHSYCNRTRLLSFRLKELAQVRLDVLIMPLDIDEDGKAIKKSSPWYFDGFNWEMYAWLGKRKIKIERLADFGVFLTDELTKKARGIPTRK